MKKGFTLIEVLAVIVILAVTSVIVTPIILGVVKTTEEKAFLESARGLLRTVMLASLEKEPSIKTTYLIRDGVSDPELTIAKLDGDGYVEVDEDHNIRLSLTNGKYCAVKRFAESGVSLVDEKCEMKPSEIVNLDQSGASIPNIDTSMVPVYYTQDGWHKADVDNALKSYQWYDYDAKMWANVAIVKSNKKAYYQEASYGTLLEENDILGFFVYIPAFQYQLNATTQEFDVSFMDPYQQGDVHPAFTWGDNQIRGFWFGKYELSGTTKAFLVLPNQSPLKNTTLTSVYNATQELNQLKERDEFNNKMAEIHLIKNMEWGATTILSQSKYGICNDGICGRVAKNELWTTGYTTRNAPYNSEKGMLASTTGNIYGVYDMVGGAWEFTMGTNNIGTLKAEITEEKYTLYPDSIGLKGDLTTEDGTAGWYNSSADFLNSYQNWFVRGGDVNTSDASIFWYRGDGPNGGFRNGFRLAYVFSAD